MRAVKLLDADDDSSVRPLDIFGCVREQVEENFSQRDFLGDFLGANPSDGELLVAFRPDREAVDGRRHRVLNKR